MDDAEIGERFTVIYSERSPGDCVLASTAENSFLFLIFMTLATVSMLLLVWGVGLLLHRSFTAPVFPARRMNVDASSVPCPSCGGKMVEGYLPLLSGIHWRSLGQPIGMPPAIHGLPGTVSLRGRPRVHAFHCAGCEIISFQYGKAEINANR